MRLNLSDKARESLYGTAAAMAAIKPTAAQDEAAEQRRRLVEEREAARRAKKDARADARQVEGALRVIVATAQASLDKASKIASEATTLEQALRNTVATRREIDLPLAKEEVLKARERLARAEASVADAEAEIQRLEAERERVLITAKDPFSAAGINLEEIRVAHEAAEAAWDKATRSAKAKRDAKLMAQARKILALGAKSDSTQPE